MRVRKMLKKCHVFGGPSYPWVCYPRTANYVFSELFPRFGNFKSQKVIIKRSKTVVPHYPL